MTRPEDSGKRDVGLTCGTLVLIALIVHFLGNSAVDDVREVKDELNQVDKGVSSLREESALLKSKVHSLERQLTSVEAKLDRLIAQQGSQQSGSSDRVELWRAVLELPGLQPYWHSDTPGRVPVRVVPHSDFPAPAQTIAKFGQPVVFVTREQLESDPRAPVLRITACRAFADGRSVSFEYPVEGVIGTVELRRRDGAWLVQSAEIAER